MLTADFDMSVVDKSIDQALARGRNLSPVFRDIRGPMKVDQQEHAAAKAGPDHIWPPRAAATMEKLRHDGRRARRPMGKLLTAVKYTSSAIGAVGESLVSWSGGAISKGGRVGKGAVLPPRVWLWASDQLQQFAGEMIMGFIFEDWN